MVIFLEHQWTIKLNFVSISKISLKTLHIYPLYVFHANVVKQNAVFHKKREDNSWLKSIALDIIYEDLQFF